MLNRLSFARSLSKLHRCRSSFVQQSQENFVNFNKLIDEKQNQLNSVYEEFRSKLYEKTETKDAYTHPLDNEHQSIVFQYGKVEELWLDLVGPEQVSPHYENFLMSRKFAVGIWATIFASSILANTRDFSWLVQSSFIPFCFFASTLYYFFEGRKFLAL